MSIISRFPFTNIRSIHPRQELSFLQSKVFQKIDPGITPLSGSLSGNERHLEIACSRERHLHGWLGV